MGAAIARRCGPRGCPRNAGVARHCWALLGTAAVSGLAPNGAAAKGVSSAFFFEFGRVFVMFVSSGTRTRANGLCVLEHVSLPVGRWAGRLDPVGVKVWDGGQFGEERMALTRQPHSFENTLMHSALSARTPRRTHAHTDTHTLACTG